MDSRDRTQRLRMLGQADLGAAIALMERGELWSIQRRIAKAVSQRRAKVRVPSCNASGKTYLAGRIALAFYNSYTPGTPCLECGGWRKLAPCRGGKVLTTSSKDEHLKDNLWGEIRAAYATMRENGVDIAGRLWESDTRFEQNKSHFIMGQTTKSAEGMQGYHASHKLIIGDEATSVEDEVQLAITRLLASADSRILLIYNPTTSDTYPARMGRSARWETIKIRAWDTPHFTNEHIPFGSNLINPDYLDDLRAQGMGEGTFEWQTSIEAEDWTLGEDILIPEEWYDLVSGQLPILGAGSRALGIDIATYGSDENVIAVRDGEQLLDIRPYPSMRTEDFVQGPVVKAVMDYAPHYVVFDADGPGAGAVGYFEDLQRFMPHDGQVIGFRGGKGVNARFLNQRSAWYWSLRRRFQPGGNQDIALCVKDDKLREQLTAIHYSITPAGDIRAETKEEMRKDGRKSPDRADAVMYAFAYAADLPTPGVPRPSTTAADTLGGLSDYSEAEHWRRMIEMREARERPDTHPLMGVADW